jgi:hypothetical protein
MKPGMLNADYFDDIFFHAYDWARFPIFDDYFRIQCVAMQMKLTLLDSVGWLDSELL